MAFEKIGERELESKPSPGEPSVSQLAARIRFMKAVGNQASLALQHLFRIYSSQALGERWSRCHSNQLQVQNWCLLHHDLAELFSIEPPFPIAKNANLRATPVLQLIKLIHLRRSEIDANRRSVTEIRQKDYSHPDSDLIEVDAYKMVFSDFNSLRIQEGRSLARSLTAWGRKFGLEGEWCMDFALHALIAFIVEHLRKYDLNGQFKRMGPEFFVYDWPVERWQARSWTDAVAELENREFGALWKGISSYPDSKPFRFEWRWSGKNGYDQIAFAISAYFSTISMTREEFISRVESDLWENFLTHHVNRPNELQGKVAEVERNLVRFRNSLEKHCEGVLKAAKPSTAKAIEKKDWDRDIEWTVRAQVLNEPFKKIGYETDPKANAKAVEMAVRSMCSIMGLAPRHRPQLGRQPGIEERFGHRSLGK